MHTCNDRFIFGFEGTAVPPYFEEMIAGGDVGGVILFARNVRDPEQVGALCAELQALRRKVSEYPLVIAVDQEGGVVNRIGAGATHFPSAMANAATGDVELAGRVGYCMGCELRAMGVTMNLAPVLDLSVNSRNPVIGTRSFGDDPERVALFGEAMISGLERAGIASVAKHFPGLGAAEKDAHHDLPRVIKGINDLEAEDLIPFRRGARAGVSGIMIGHACYPSLSPSPASVSSEIMEELLRVGLRYNGLAITDDLEMGAVSRFRSVAEAAVQACAAGADLMLICHSVDQQRHAQAALAAASGRGELRDDLLAERSERLCHFGEEMRRRISAHFPDPTDSGDLLARRVAEGAITVASDKERILPLRMDSKQKLLVLLPEAGALTAVESGASGILPFTDAVIARHRQAEIISFGIIPSADECAQVLRVVRESSFVVMGTCNAHCYPAQAKLIRDVAAMGKRAIFIALRNPYDIELYPSRVARIAAYGSDPHTLAALGKVIFGDLQPRGTLPVKLKM